MADNLSFFTPLKFNHNILIIVFFIVSQKIIAQKIHLEIKSKDSIENSIIKRINFNKIHESDKSIQTELNLFSEKLKKNGYFFNELDSLTNTQNKKAYFKLNQKIDSIYINLNHENTSETRIKKIPIEKINFLLDSISTSLERKGELFSRIRLKNISQKKKNIFADLSIQKTLLRRIDTTLIKGYVNFPIKYIKNHLKIKKRDLINKDKLNEISEKSKSLAFISEIKPPETLFTRDSTLVYLYFKKNKINNFDGLLNFSSDEDNNGILFTGYLNLELNNIFDKGESFSLLWKANGKNNQNFTLKTRIPYIFNSFITPELEFNIHKQDSTFLNTKLNTKLLYNYNEKSSLGITYTSENSIKTLDNLVNNDSISNFSNSFLGLFYNYKINKQDIFNNNKFYFELNPSLGKRNSTQQFKLNFRIQYVFDFNKKSSFFLNNNTAYLGSKTTLTNELYRIGGVNSIRGFDEESIFTSKYTYVNSEYRYLTSKKSYIYSITDIGYYKPNHNLETKTIYSLGLGYLFKINNSLTNINYTFGKNDVQNSLINNSRISITYRNFF